MEIIVFSGKAQSGKDTAAKIAKDYLEEMGNKVLITHYADLLKYICKTFLDWDGKKNDYGRKLLQEIGTEGFRSYNQDYWVNFIIDVLKVLPDKWDYVLIPDCRFPNEISRLREAGFVTTRVHIERGVDNPLNQEAKNHSSENTLSNIPSEIVIYNKWDESYFEYSVREVIKYFFTEREV